MTMRPKYYRPYIVPRTIRKNDKRAPAWQRGYDEDWRKLRNWYICQHPMCCVPGCDRPADEIDHIVPIEKAPERRLDATNLQSLCKSHHVLKTWEDKRRELKK